MAIISASRRTDIPAFFPEWFMERVREGFFQRINPFNYRQVKQVSLKPDDVEAIVFWTKNPAPLFRFLPELDQSGIRYYFQFTLNPYDRLLEPHLPPLAERIETFHALAEMVGARRVIWRYDPIILSSVTPISYHQKQFAGIAAKLSGATELVIFSFLDFYRKTSKRVKTIERIHGINFFDIRGEEYNTERRQLLADLRRSAAASGISIRSCAEAEDLEETGIEHGRCIDGNLLQELFGSSGKFKKDKYQRKECGCVESIDMGIYNTCPHHCAYCYANAGPQTIAANLKKHFRTNPG